MRLLTQSILIAAAVILLGFASETMTRRFVVWPETKALADQLDRKELEQVLLGFDVLRSQLQTFVRTNGYWDTAYEYLDKPDEKFIPSNFPLPVFEQNSFNLVMFLSADRRFQKILMTTPDQEDFLQQAVLTTDNFVSVLPDVNQARANAPLETSGFIKTPVGPMVFAAVTVMPTNLNGDANGILLIARFIDKDAIEEVAETVKKSFELESIVNNRPAVLLSSAQRDENNKIYTDLLDVQGKPLLRIAMNLPATEFNPWWSLASSVSLLVFVIGASIAMTFVYRSLVVPIGALSGYLHRVRQTDDYSARLKIWSSNELGSLAQECNSLLEHIDTQHQRLEEQAKELRRLSLHDGLTQISNRRHFDEALDVALANAQRHKLPLTLLLCDIDHFKLFNDTYGHQGGDKALQAFAEILMLARHRKTDLVARYGGEEFVVLLADTDEYGAKHVLANIQNLLLKANIPHATSPVANHLTVSVGVVCMYAPFDLTAQELIRRADESLYLAKKNGRNRAEFWLSQKPGATQSNNTVGLEVVGLKKSG